MNTDVSILIADDSSFMRKVLRNILQEAGFTKIAEAENGKQALEKYKNEEKPGLLLLDVIMPEMDGMEVLKRIGKEAKIIVISAVGQELMIEDAKKNGAAGYIIKPFDKKQVIDEINRVAS